MIHFTKHALDKLKILKGHGFPITKFIIINTVSNPEMVDYSRSPLKIAQRGFDKDHVLRVVYKEENRTKIIITFYPGRKSQYEK